MFSKLKTLRVHAQYDWMTGVPDNEHEWRKFRVIRRSEGLLNYQGRAGIVSILYARIFARPYPPAQNQYM